VQRAEEVRIDAVVTRRISETNKEIAFGRDGNLRHYAVRVTPMLNVDKFVVGTMLTFHDLTEIRRTEIAEASNKAKSKFFAMISHEIRTPMNAIQGVTEIKMQNEALEPDIAEAFYMIHNSSNVLLNLINDVLDLSKMEAGKFELVPIEYETAVFINDTTQLNMTLVKNKPIEFKLLVDENTPSVFFGDPMRIRQILSNLLSNAFKYTAEGVVELSFYVEPGNAGAEGGDTDSEITPVLRVSDTGQGMTAEQISALFDEYSRFNPQANRGVEGTGLGMNITQHLIQMMNGGITVESEPGKGTIFTVRLPQGIIGAGTLGELAEDLQQFRWSSVSRMRKASIMPEPMPYGSILIVDDVESNLYVAKGLTAPYKLLVDTASSGLEAINKIKNGSVYDIIFMDHMMPKMDGIEATKIIRGSGYTQPIVALTANALTEQTEMFLANGFNDYLSKPIDIRRLDILLNKFIRDKQPQEVIEATHRQTDIPGDTGSQMFIDQALLEIFVEDAEEAIQTIEEICKKEVRDDDDMQMYTITVHGMRGALATISETELSAYALKLEKAGDAKNAAEMLSGTPGFLDGLRALIRKIKPREEDGVFEDVAEDNAYLCEKLSAIKTACDAYKKRPAKTALADLKLKEWRRSTEDVLNTLARHLLHGEFEKASALSSGTISHGGTETTEKEEREERRNKK
jgi:signal transduction histidine kinase/DNA-binding response OmpR family regulator